MTITCIFANLVVRGLLKQFSSQFYIMEIRFIGSVKTLTLKFMTGGILNTHCCIINTIDLPSLIERRNNHWHIFIHNWSGTTALELRPMLNLPK